MAWHGILHCTLVCGISVSVITVVNVVDVVNVGYAAIDPTTFPLHPE